MKKKFKIIDCTSGASTGQKLKLREKEMFVMNSQGIFFIVGNFMDYDTYVRKLSAACPVYDVQWKGEE